MIEHSRYYADGSFCSANGAVMPPFVSPVDGRVLGHVTACSADDVEAAVASAHRAFPVWAASSLDQRRDVLKRLRTELESRAPTIVQSLAAEIGCPIWLGRLMQVPMPLKGLELALEGLDHIPWQETIGNGLVERVPAGVVAAITPWNFPLHQMVAKVAAAIGAGCTIVVKPSEITPGAAQQLFEALDTCGLPPGVVNLVWGGPDVGQQLVSHPKVRRVSFTGSTAVGRRIMAGAAEGLKPVTLELGGKSAAVILDDADLDATIPAVVRMSMANSGQACVSQSRLIVPARLASRVVERFAEALTAWPLGDPTDEATRLGPVATAVQHRHVVGMIERAITDGAKLLLGGSAPPAGLEPGCCVQPTLFGDVRPDMEIAQQEVFGPVVSLLTYDTDDEAAELANATAYGLSGAVWSGDAQRATIFARRLATGQVVINGAAQNLATPFGGWGDSGFGHENGRFGIEDLLQYRALHGAG
ncbi:MAG: aldehyde dehydrogenase family protein [Pigmentiphaga sp.]